MALPQTFLNMIVVTFVRYDEATDFYKELKGSAVSLMPDVSGTQDIIYPWTVSPACLLTASLLVLAW